MIKIMVAFGTRPEAIKMAPLVKELKKTDEIETIICVTGQHREMLEQVMNVFEIKSNYNLNVMKPGQDLFDITENILKNVKEVLLKEKPDIVLVHGDTTTTFAVSLACFYLKIKVGHVEAGLRTNDLMSPYPEEFNRRVTGIIANLHFAPTESAKQNLIREGKREETIFVTGNTVIDALETTVSNNYYHKELEWAKDSKLVLLTAHRRENIGKPLENILKAVRRVVEENNDIKVIYPVHLNPIIRKAAYEIFENQERIHLIEPLDVFDFHNFMANSYLILTDSGGIQEEAPALGKPVLVMRTTTERPEGVEAGTLKLIGTEEEMIYKNFSELLNDGYEYNKMANANNPYGDGNASKRIIDILYNVLSIQNNL